MNGFDKLAALVLAATLGPIAAFCLGAELYATRVRLSAAEDRTLAAVKERRECGDALLWCQGVARETCGLVVDVLRSGAKR
ncbi:MAG: hypothetical protein IT381_21165 [Deltaproteobacteria bacterium]|nr:hypothetical protein [Deltaproteobacteria bacterium]